MAESSVASLEGLPSNVATVLSAFLTAARNDLAADLISAVLFGSAAEGKLGPTSDVNLLLVLRTFAPDKIRRLRDAFLTAEAAIKLRVMFVLEDELASAAELFAQKFADMLRRHRTIFGKDVLGSLKVARQSEVFRLRQILLNLVLRLRESCIARGQRPEQIARILADMFGPLRAACATLLELEGGPASRQRWRALPRRSARLEPRRRRGCCRPTKGRRWLRLPTMHCSRCSRSRCRFFNARRG